MGTAWFVFREDDVMAVLQLPDNTSAAGPFEAHGRHVVWVRHRSRREHAHD